MLYDYSYFYQYIIEGLSLKINYLNKDQLDNGTIQKTPLLQQGHNTVRTMHPGIYRVTGGYIRIGTIKNGQLNRITGIIVDTTPLITSPNYSELQ